MTGWCRSSLQANAALDVAPQKMRLTKAQAMLSRGDVLGAERKFVEIADTVRKIKEKADVVEARAILPARKVGRGAGGRLAHG